MKGQPLLGTPFWKLMLLGGVAATVLTLAGCGGTDSHGYQVPATVTPFPFVKLAAP